MAKNGKKGKQPNKIKVVRINLSWLYILILLGIGYMLFSTRGGAPQKIEWAQVKEMMLAGDVKEVHYLRDEYRGSLTMNPESMSKYVDLFINGKVPSGSPQFIFITSGKFDPENMFGEINEQLPEDQQVKIIMENSSSFWKSISEWLPLILLIVLWIWMFRGMSRNMGGQSGGGNGGMNPFNMGKASDKLTDKDAIKVTFKDVAGLYGAKEEIVEIVDFLKNKQKYIALGAKIPKGALLVGPPGTGKTLLAKAVAGEANVPFFSISGSDFVEMFVGVGASRVRDLFKQAKEKAPCIVFIDEIDAVGRARINNRGFSGGDSERENTLNQLLTEMDGFGTNSGVIVLAATNRVDILDKALLRAGRFDRQIHVTLPDINERKEIFQVHTRELKLAPDFNLENVAKHTPGMSGADIANVCNEAALNAARSGKKAVDNKDFLDAIDRVVAGIERKKTVMSKDEKRLTAFHEVGHAVAGWLLPGCEPVLKVSIIPRGEALGLTWYLPDEKVTLSKNEMIDNMSSLVAGRVAEQIVNDGVPCTGALNDFQRLTATAYRMVAYFGMSEAVGNVSFYDPNGDLGSGFNKPYSEKTAELIDSEVKSIVNMVTERTEKLLRENWEKIEVLAAKLIDKEIIMASDLEEVLGPKAGKHGEERLKDSSEEQINDNSIATDE